jgi:hypothetical protein
MLILTVYCQAFNVRVYVDSSLINIPLLLPHPHTATNPLMTYVGMYERWAKSSGPYTATFNDLFCFTDDLKEQMNYCILYIQGTLYLLARGPS